MAVESDPAHGLVRLWAFDDGVVTADVTGDLDGLVSDGVRRRLVDAAGPHVEALVVNLNSVTLLSAAAIAMLVDVVRMAGERGSQVRFVAACRAVLRPLAITGDDVHLPLYTSHAAALGA